MVISCLFFTESGDLYTFGESEGGKLGLGDDPDDTESPQKVDIPEPVTTVACGGSHTVALTGIFNIISSNECNMWSDKFVAVTERCSSSVGFWIYACQVTLPVLILEH